MAFTKLCPLSELSMERMKKYVVDGSEFLAGCDAQGRVWVCDATCTHADKPLEKGRWDAASAQLTCPFHKAIFALAECGAVKAPPAFVPLKVYPVELRADNGIEWVWVNFE